MPPDLKRGDRARRSRPSAVALLIALLLGSVGLAQPRPVHAADPILPFGFTDNVVISGLSLPTNLAFAPDGKIFVAEQAGRIKMFDSVSDTTPTLVADLRPQVYHYWDKGLLGLTVDPAYPTRSYIYALYSYDATIGGTAPLWNDACPGPPAGPEPDGCVSSSRLSRLTLGTNAVMTQEKVLINDWCGQYQSHSIGTVTFGGDGLLYAGGGEGASFNIYDVDHGQYGGTVIDPDTGEPYVPANPCGDPPGGVGVALSPPNAQGGSLRSQSPRRPAGQPTTLDGSIIRVDPDTGDPATTNPAYSSGRDKNEKRIIAYGLRNPYRFTFKPGTNELWVGDVGSWRYEEINRIPNPTGNVRNHGWPCYEGPFVLSAWDELNVNSCEALYAAGATAHATPYFSYRHAQPVSAGDPCPTNAGVLSAMAFEKGGTYPTRYRNALFFADYGRKCIWTMRPGTNGLPDPSRLEVFVQTAAGPVDFEFGPDGQLYYVDIGGGTIHRVTYDGDNQAPVVIATAQPTSGPAPLEVDFDASASHDVEGDPLTIDWDLDGDGAYDDASGPKVTHIYAAGFYTATVRVRDDHANSATKSWQIDSGNQRPTPVIDTPTQGTTWRVGQNLNFSGHATDDKDGTLPASRLSWRWIMHHCAGSGPSDCHQHLVLEANGQASGTFTAPSHEYPSYLELQLTATDSSGLSATASRTFHPRAVELKFTTNPAGLELHAAGETNATPFTRTFIVGTQIALNAAESQWHEGVTYHFDAWSDGGAAAHSIVAPATATTYTASYSGAAAADAPNTCAGATSDSAQDTWLGNTLASRRDVDWYRFSVSSSGWSRVVLGNLGRNYRLDLHRACGELIASSIRPGKQFEEIYRQLEPGTYRVKVKRQGSRVAPSISYGLKFSQLSEGVQVLSSSAWTSTTSDLVIVGDVLNNTAQRRRLIEYKATLFDSGNNVLATHKNWGWVSVVPSRERSQIRMVLPKPAGYHHYSLEITYSQQTTETAVGGFAVTSSTQGSDASGIWFRGQFTNTNTFTAKWVSAMFVLYDKWGAVLNVDQRRTSPFEISPNGSATYDVPFSEHFSGWNRHILLIQGTRGT